jgi:hypothetical protein
MFGFWNLVWSWRSHQYLDKLVFIESSKADKHRETTSKLRNQPICYQITTLHL